MSRRKTIRTRLYVVVAAFAAMLVPALVTADLKRRDDSGTAPVQSSLTLTPIGNPIWRPVDFHVFSAPIGDPANFDDFVETILGMWGPPYHPVISGQPHPPPYYTELGDGLARQGYHEGDVFTETEFARGMGIYAMFMLIPDPGTTGSSPDFASGPIIPNVVFPIDVDGTLRRNGALFDADLDSQMPPINEVDSRFADLDGYSHTPFFFATSMDFAPVEVTAEGDYEYEFRMLDQTGQGWVARSIFRIMTPSARSFLPLMLR